MYNNLQAIESNGIKQGSNLGNGPLSGSGPHQIIGSLTAVLDAKNVLYLALLKLWASLTSFKIRITHNSNP